MSMLTFSCTALNGTNKEGILKPDERGYYYLPLGALNVFNSMGQFYPYEGAKDLFLKSSAFMRQIAQGCLKSEEGHPEPLPGERESDFLQRVSRVNEKNVCAHIASVSLDFDNVRDDRGNKVIAIMGRVTPAGPYGPSLAKSLVNPEENVCFSVRAFTLNKRVGGVMHRTLREIITWDRVTEPGLHAARKFFSPALECYEREVKREDAVAAFAPAAYANESLSCAMEADQQMGRSLLQALGWDYDHTKIPASLQGGW